MKKKVMSVVLFSVCVALAVILPVCIYSDGSEKEKSRMIVCAELVGDAGEFAGISVSEGVKFFSDFEKTEDNNTETEENESGDEVMPLDEKIEEEKKQMKLPSAEGAS